MWRFFPVVPGCVITRCLQLMLVFTLSVIASGCASNAVLNEPVSTEQRDVLLAEDLSEVAAISVPFGGYESEPVTIWLNDVAVGTQHRGLVRLPLLPGSYRLKTQLEGHESNELMFTIRQGQELYFKNVGPWIWSPYGEIPRHEFQEWFDNLHWYSRVVIEPSRPRHDYLPQAERQLVKACLDQPSLETCAPVYDTIPHVLIAPAERQTMVTVVESDRRAVAADERRRVLEASLPKEVLVDKYMIALRDALAARNYEKALPAFERLEELEVPLDPDFYYFYGEALHETGRQEEALEATGKYLREQGSQARFYEDALQLLNQIQEVLG
ncbi:tetratricopeptide repeat protein [Marinobacter sp. 2_MG-2023]|uniref:tetratricopeptide repeat protein n=1 Tax=Marinobacter sp. 2_MG-2023 TaxID=3062679 RepID=UPI0026E278CE|nr:tetratricopeptide repeat protein [Marinobacter sp. 2_MG-2023]MDO6442824.1 tetratricopeptide repeat protein [Marinobacter sp. 2_MG-2023]